MKKVFVILLTLSLSVNCFAQISEFLNKLKNLGQVNNEISSEKLIDKKDDGDQNQNIEYWIATKHFRLTRLPVSDEIRQEREKNLAFIRNVLFLTGKIIVNTKEEKIGVILGPYPTMEEAEKVIKILELNYDERSSQDCFSGNPYLDRLGNCNDILKLNKNIISNSERESILQDRINLENIKKSQIQKQIDEQQKKIADQKAKVDEIKNRKYSAAPAKFKVQRDLSVATGNGILIVSLDDSPMILERVIVNNRINNQNCDKANLVEYMETGDARSLTFVGCGAVLTRIDIYTNRGSKTFTMNQ